MLLFFKTFHVLSAMLLKRKASSLLTNLVTHWYNLIGYKCFYIKESSLLWEVQCCLPYITFVLTILNMKSVLRKVHCPWYLHNTFILQALQLELRSCILWLGPMFFYLTLRLPLNSWRTCCLWSVSPSSYAIRKSSGVWITSLSCLVIPIH